MVISVIGAVASIGVSLTGAILANRNNIILQTRKLKEEHYVNYIEALHYLAGDNVSNDVIGRYVLSRDKLFLIASEDVVQKILQYEREGVGVDLERHDFFLTELVKSLRRDLEIKDVNFPTISLKKTSSV